MCAATTQSIAVPLRLAGNFGTCRAMWAPLLAALLLLVARDAAGSIRFAAYTKEDEKYRLPSDFLIGAGTSAYQTEGAWNVSGKGISVYDYFYNYEKGHESRGNGNFAADSYNHIDDDIEVIKQLKIYRFSLSWTRLLPDGDPSKPNEDGIRYYNEIIDKLRKINVQPMITIYHFDHPQILYEKHNGWLGKGMIDSFAQYADFAFRTFGNKVKYWITVNEPNTYCGLAHAGMMVPRQTVSPVGDFYTCQHNQLLAHARAYRNYQQNYVGAQGGKVGLVCFSDINKPNSTKYEDIRAAERANLMGLGMCAGPAVTGDYPELALAYLREKDAALNRSTSRVPSFTPEEKIMLMNGTDFVGLNIYYGYTVADCKAAGQPADLFFGSKGDADLLILIRQHEGGPSGPTILNNAFSVSHPWAMHLSLVWARDNFQNTPIFITKSGYEDFAPSGINDEPRAIYHSEYLRTMAQTINEYGVNVLGITFWTLIDDFEWERAYRSKMGLVHVDYTSPDRTRTLKDSSALFIKVATDRQVPAVVPTSSAATSSLQPDLLVLTCLLIAKCTMALHRG